MEPNSKSTLSSRRGISALVLGLIIAALPLSVAGTAGAACSPEVPPEVCNLLPGTPGVPIDNIATIGRSFVPATPQVKLNGKLFLHNLSPELHLFVIPETGDYKHLGVGRAGALSDQIQILGAPRGQYQANRTYAFNCAIHPEMKGVLTVIP